MVLRLRSGWACSADVAHFFATCLVGSSCAAELHLGLPGPLLREKVVSCPDPCPVAYSAIRAPTRAGGLSVSPGSTLVPTPIIQRLPKACFKGRCECESCTGSNVFRGWWCLTDPVPKPLEEKERFVRQRPPRK